MLGIHRMTHEGKARVVSCELDQSAFGVTSTNSHGQSTTSFDLILDVFPDGAEPFRAENKRARWRSTIAC